jgi:hypothetical protein
VVSLAFYDSLKNQCLIKLINGETTSAIFNLFVVTCVSQNFQNMLQKFLQLNLFSLCNFHQWSQDSDTAATCLETYKCMETSRLSATDITRGV